MPDAGCGNDRCCFDESEGISACQHWSDVVGFLYDEDMSPVNHDDCWVGIAEDEGQSAQEGCRDCGHGCHGFEDKLVNLFLSALWVGGKSYLRSEIDAQFGRDAKNRVFDLRTNTPTLIQRRCRLEHGSCYENNPLQSAGYVCWGHHVCQCTPGPTWTPVAECDNLLGGGYPVDGLIPDEFFFNYQGWPPDGGVFPSSLLFCRKWHPANGGSPRNAAFYVHKGGKDKGPVHNASFLRSREGLNVDALVPCAGRVADSICYNVSGATDCTYARERPVDSRINTQTSSQGEFDELWIDLPTVDIRMRDFPSLSEQQLREHQLYRDIFAEAIVADGTGRVYPDTEVGSITMDRIEMPTSANHYIGYYDRWFNGPDWTEADLPRIMEFPYCRTRWGNVPITAYMVITYCKIVVHLTVPHFARYVRDPEEPNEHWIKPFATVEIHVNVAMLCDPVTTGITVGGVPVTVTNPMWVPGQGYDGIPTATPDGNEIIYARELEPERHLKHPAAGSRPGTGATRTGKPLPVRVPRKWRWFGRLGSFSDPVTAESDFDFANMNCEDLIGVIETFAVPALATANESRPDDPNRNYAGSIAFHFQSTA